MTKCGRLLLAASALWLGLASSAGAVDLKGMDRQVRPGDDFWRYANGAWDRATPIPADKHTTGGAWILDDISETRVRAIADDAALASANPIARKVHDYTRAYLNIAARDAAGAAPLQPMLQRIDAVRDQAALAALFADTAFPSPYEFFVSGHPKEPERYALFVSQAGLGLPDRDYYLSAEPRTKGYRDAYRAYLVLLSQLAGLGDAEARADRVLALETALAKVQWERSRTRDVSQTINPMTLAEVEALAPQLRLAEAIEANAIPSAGTIIVWTPSALADTAKLLASEPLETWKDWVRLRAIDRSAPQLSSAFAKAEFDFRQRSLRGIETPPPAWQRAVRLANRDLPDAVGQLYVERHLPPAAQAKARQLVDDVAAAFEERLRANRWMDEPTRKQALDKLARLGRDVGAPERYIDYSTVEVRPDDPLGNVHRLARFASAVQFARVGQPVTNDYWDVPPQIVNGYYNFFDNRLRILAGWLQPPYFDAEGDPAANYAAIGAVIGHEIGHGFDDQGRKFDATGKMRDWWTEKSSKAFDAQTRRLIDQYSAFSPVPGLKLNGKLTLGENIGDLGGLEMAFAAWRRHVARTGEPPVIDGLTGDKRFFIAYGQAWREKSRPDFLRQMVATDPHSPGIFRANGAVRNVDVWYKLFDVKPGDDLYLPPSERVRIW